MIFEIFRGLEGRDRQKPKQHRVDEAIVGGSEYHHVVRLPFAVNCTAHRPMNENDAGQRYRQEKRAQNQRQCPGGKAVQPRSQVFDHAPQAGLKDAVAAPIADVSVGTATLGQSQAEPICSHDPQGPLDDRRLQRRVNQDLMARATAAIAACF
jgi:hypothetical protein